MTEVLSIKLIGQVPEIWTITIPDDLVEWYKENGEYSDIGSTEETKSRIAAIEATMNRYPNWKVWEVVSGSDRIDTKSTA